MNEVLFIYLTLERSRCFGSCPVYRFKVFQNGVVEYEGVENVKKAGKHTWQLDHKTIIAIDKAIDEVDYFGLAKLESEQLILMTDAASCTTEVKMKDGRMRKIMNEDEQWPPALTKFEKRIDKLAGIDAW